MRRINTIVSEKSLPMQSVVIIGAPRSGTNMLRDVLTSFDGIGTWPCDEINYIWRHGNAKYPSDEIPEDMATPKVLSYIRDRFEAIRREQDVNIVVEKTCANCLRIPFVDRALPNAKYIYIYRDGIDAAGSIKQRWAAGLDISYLMKKVRFVPISDVPYYGARYLWSRIYRVLSNDKRLAFWGPKFNDMQDMLMSFSLNEVCAIQWQRCVDKAEAGLSLMPANKIAKVRYEDFVNNPAIELKKLLNFLGYEVSEERVSTAVKCVSTKSLGKGREVLGEDEVRRLEALVSASLKRYGYL